MPTPQFPSVSSNATLDDLRDAYIGMSRYLTYLLSALDTLNISRLDAKVIIADSITADKLDVDELSAISANLGEIMAGIIRGVSIFGSYIATRENAYPRAEMNDDDDLVAVYTTATKLMQITPSLFGTPAAYFDDGSTQGALYPFPLAGGTMLLQSSSDIDLVPGAGKSIKIPDWSQLYSTGASQTLQQALASIYSTLSSLQSQINSLASRVSALENP